MNVANSSTPRDRGLQMFWEANRLDFILRDPQKGTLKARLLFSNLEKSEDGMVLRATEDTSVDGNEIHGICRITNRDTGEINPGQIGVLWNTDDPEKALVMGLTAARNGGKSYYYRGLETANDQARPRTIQDVFTLIG